MKLSRRSRGLLLLFLLMVPSLLSDVPFISAQEENYWVELELGGVYGLRGEVIDITSKTNYAGSNVRIYDPDDVLIYDQNWVANDTRQIPISDSAAYGTYRIVARVPEAQTETWFTVLDITGWSPIDAWPYVVSHNNIEYTFYSDWTLKVKLHDDEMYVDFSTLRKLATAYDMEVQPLKNDMNFLVRFSKGAIKIDWNFAFIHSGAKIIINGTLDHARDISINFDAKTLNKWITGLSSGQIVFDWSDVLGGEWWTYLPEEKELMIHAPQNFRIDPAIFSNGFEECDFSAWTGNSTSNGVVEVITANPHHGTYHANVTTDNVAAWCSAYVYKQISAESTLYSRMYIYINSMSGANYMRGILGFQSGSEIVRVGLTVNRELRLRYLNVSTIYDVVSATVLNTTQWYSLELKAVIDGVNGEYRVYLDGVEINDITQTAIDTDDHGSINRVRVGVQDAYALASDFDIDCVVIDSSYIGPEGAGNNAPSNDASSIGNMDDSDNVYSQLRDYNLILNVSDADGIAELDFVQYALEIGTGWINGTIDAQSNAHTFQAGSTNCTVGAVTNETTATTANYTVPIKFDWDIQSASDNDIHLWVNDTVGDDSGWAEKQTDYFDTVNDLVTNSIECTDANNPDRVDISSSIDVDFEAFYENDPSSGVATTFYPPDAEFTSISVYNEWDGVLGTDNSIVNGAGSVTGTANASVQSTNYNLYINMADADYSDGEETTTETVITDRIIAYSEALDDTRVDINTNIEWRIKAVLDYDDHPLGAGDGVSCSWGALAWDAGNSWFDISHSEATVQGVTITLTSGSEATYGITSFSENITETTGIFDRIMVYDEALNDSRVNLNDVIEGRYKAVLDYDDHDLGAGDQLNCSWGALAWDAGNSWFEITNTSAAVTGVTVGGWTGSEATHGITAIAENITETTWIWDQAVVYYFQMDDTRVDINTNAEDRIRFVLDYDDHAGGAGDTLNVNGSAAAWDAGNGWFENITSVNAIVNYTFVVTTVSEATYGITSYTVNVSNPWCVWDRVNVTLSVPDSRINVATSSNIGESAVYAFDGGAHAGVITLNDTETQASVGNYTYTVSSLTDTNYGLTAFLSNDVWCVFDQQQLQTLGVNNSTPAANENVTMWLTCESSFDAHALTNGDSIELEDSDGAVYVFAWNGSMFTNSTSWPANGTITINTWNMVNETTYNITTLDMNSLSLVITVGTSPPPSGNTFDLQVITSDGVGIENANVRLYNASDLFSVNTNSTGQIAQQTFDSGNYTLTILRTGYLLYNHTYSWTTSVNLVVALTTDTELAGFGILPVLLGFMGLVVILAANRRRR